MTQELKEWNLRKVPADLILDVKLAATAQGLTMPEWVIAACRHKLIDDARTKSPRGGA